MGRVNLKLAVVVIVIAIAATLYFGRKRSAGDGPFAQEVADAVPRIEKSTGMKFKRPPRVEARSKDQVRDFLVKKFDETTPASEIAAR